MSDTIDIIDTDTDTDLAENEATEPSFLVTLGQTVILTAATVATAYASVLFIEGGSKALADWSRARAAKKKAKAEKDVTVEGIVIDDTENTDDN